MSAERGLRPISPGAPALFAEAPPLFAAHYGSANDAFDAAVACERLGFGYEMVAYQAPVGDDGTTVREWRVTAWSHVEGDCGPFVKPEEQDLDA